MKGPLKVNNPITSKVNLGLICGPFLSCKNKIGIENKDPRMYV